MSKELIKEYANLRYPENKRMNDYILKSTSEVIKTSQGFLIRFEKPSIQTSFCFSAGLNGYCTNKEWDESLKECEKMKNNANKFLSENLQEINKRILELKEAQTVHFCTIYANDNIARDYKININNREEVIKNHLINDLKAVEASKEDIKLILETLENEKAKFEKRLNSYLKRYGLSKVKTWNFISD